MTELPLVGSCTFCAGAATGAPMILVLHLVGAFRSRYALETNALARILEGALAAGWTIQPLDAMLRMIDQAGHAPPRTIALTFDDAYACLVEDVLPITDALGIAGTVFVNTEAVGGTNTWNRRASFRVRHCGWSDLKVLRNAGWEIGSHGHGHFNMLALTDEEIREDLSRSIEHIEARLACTPKSFAYPFGKFDSRVIAVVEEQFRVAVATERGVPCALHHRLALSRFWPEAAPAHVRWMFDRITTHGHA